MNSELNYVKNKKFSRLAWLAFYTLVAIALIIVAVVISGEFKTRSIPIGDISLSVPYSKYVVGEDITFTVKNGYNSPIYVTNTCPGEPLNVYKWVDNKWSRIHDKASLKDCPDQTRNIEVAANSSVSGDFKAWPNLFNSPGKYRVVAYVEYYDALPYRDFEVIAKPVPVEAPSINVIPTVSVPLSSSPQQQVVPVVLQKPTTTYTEPAESNDD